jgi:hypothetical protein
MVVPRSAAFSTSAVRTATPLSCYHTSGAKPDQPRVLVTG